MTEYVVYDVFTDTAFGGNQLAVFPDATTLHEDKLQQIAAEFNYSEVTFVYPSENPDNTAKVRIFTPTSEIPFAGHPIIGTVIALANQGTPAPMVLELGVGPLRCTLDGNNAAFTTEVPLERFAEPAIDLVAAAVGIDPGKINTTTHNPIQAGLGLPFVLVELTDRGSLAACVPDTSVFRQGAKRYPTGLDFAVFAYVRDGGTISSRMFAPLDNIPEDPATGSASAALAAMLTDLLGGPQTLTYTQGQDMGRTSKIFATTTHNPTSVTISGTAIKTMAGRFIL
ncbi:MAG: PhzF family phenazine biosynthesis protein [Hyphomonadaceae bacterium]|nr:PhzF family phenazine biosynthesis protein [Hyphomonadaceae bacterium]